ncbi:hypothetical protein INT45_010851 [Circinella minor]|uniref:Chitin-binding type-2 domain-containing protein n=1 Tax=Circinella minor TaxID=1195481 RepID=A0A8H7VMZ5_9FUNG|nr:hypothetical protein INT45_010851 [Circinella minor]
MHLYSVVVTTLLALSMGSAAPTGGEKETNPVDTCANLSLVNSRYAPIQDSCTKYYYCPSKSKKPEIYECKSGKQFNKLTGKCDTYDNVGCKDGKSLDNNDKDKHHKRSEYLDNLYTDHPRSSKNPNDVSDEKTDYPDLKRRREDPKAKRNEDSKKHHEDPKKRQEYLDSDPDPNAHQIGIATDSETQ